MNKGWLGLLLLLALQAQAGKFDNDYGWGRPGAGTRAESLLHDLPVCEEAFRLRKSAQP